jgi:Flp pilus assembly protein TadG
MNNASDFSSEEGLWIMRAIRNLAFGREGSQLLELAIVLPLLAAMIVGIFDFGEAYNLKQKLNNTAREAARFAAGQNSMSGLNDSDVAAIVQVVNSYLQSAGLTQCTFGAPTKATFVYTSTATGTGCGSASLVIDRVFHINAGTAGTKVTLVYPFTWRVGNVMRLLLPSSTLTLPTTLSTDAIMQNLN